MDDFELLQAWRAGDRDAGQQLAKRHYGALRRFITGKVNEDVAWIITQKAFLTLCENKDQFRGCSSFRSYLFGIGRWKLVEYLRAQRKLGERFDPLTESVVDPQLDLGLSTIFANQQREQLLVQALRKLPLDHQLMLTLKTFETMTHREIAEVFELNEAQVAGHIHRARKRLREEALRLATDVSAVQEITGDALDQWIAEVMAQLSEAVAMRSADKGE